MLQATLQHVPGATQDRPRSISLVSSVAAWTSIRDTLERATHGKEAEGPSKRGDTSELAHASGRIAQIRK